MSGHRAKRRRLNTDEGESVESDDSHVSNERLHDSGEASTSNEPQIIIDPDEQNPSDEQWSGESKDDSDSVLATCRLRHGLNDDCLCEVFKFLAVYDLIQLCELDIYFQNLITKWVIGKKLINFTKMDPCWTTNKIFQIFGKSMRKIKIAEENTLGCFEKFLSFVKQYCAIGGLTDVELRFSEPTAPQAIIDQSMPHFANLRQLVLNDNYTRVWYKEFLAGIAVTATNLTHLTLEGVNVSGEWLTNVGMQNLKELRLHASKRRSMNIQTNELAVFLRSKPKLEIFSHIGTSDITDVIDSLTESCPKLKSFADFHLNNPHDIRTVTNINAQMMHRYTFVRQFTGVTTLGLTSYTQCGSDVYYPLIKLAVQNRVEALKIYMDRNNTVVLPENNQMRYSHRDFGHYTRLRSIELQIRSDASDQCELNAEFICDFVSKLENIEKFTVMCEPALKDVNKIVDKAPHLKELGISHTKMKYLPVEMLKIVRSIRKRRKALIADGINDPEPFHLVVNIKQLREVQVYDDVKTILKATVDSNDESQSFNLMGV
ncbi:uncharacterized protein LOC129570445 [Sitodiplosis mosellana]|uniref:uncharacterized protein LOC129570445 n=1 Tax=Sitodiplosis mosellana TaxID=263140 RepID=UPI002443807F|nr:uncharacterized protein LOC129570445 [Sitodiplosis mosellana]